mmetsp:Transcript_104727/g.180610  ORF Transcript_104727/g.180610 Transcript_104727/m.180610 type:complete len:236 (-) Transcript_104727:47-754(-)
MMAGDASMTRVDWRLVTGSTQGIGRSITETLLRIYPQDRVIMACRDTQRGAQAGADLTARTCNHHIRCERLDASSHSSVCDLRGCLAQTGAQLRAVVINAAKRPQGSEETAQGLELQIATNVLGYLWMIRELSRLLLANAQAIVVLTRVVNVALHWAGDLGLEHLQFQTRPYDNDTAYWQFKQANHMLTVTWAAKLGSSVLINACHPGDPRTKLSQGLHSCCPCASHGSLGSRNL